MDRIVIVGAGQGAAQCVEGLRRKGYGGELTIIGDEPVLPYQRPPLSKKYLAGELPVERMLLRHEAFYAEQRIAMRTGRRVMRIDRGSRRLHLDDGALQDYDALIIATGSRPRSLPLAGVDAPGVHVLRTMADADALRVEAAAGKHAVIIGGGYIGLETAATLRQLGMEVTVLEAADRLMNRVVAEPISSYYHHEHTHHDVTIRCGARVNGLRTGANGRIAAVLTDAGELAADLLVIGVGVVPNEELAREAGLDCDNGILVDERCRTADPVIYAIGDCSNHPSMHYGRRVRLESVDNAFEQAATVAANLAGIDTVHNRVPWFWSDQYHQKLLIVGLAAGHDQMVLRGDPASHSFSCCYLRAGELIAIDTVNNAKDQMAARKLIAARFRPDPAKLADSSIALKDCSD
ncbi:MAG: NAD(P)/FAD-dependent oxidoreductase [Nevskiaceae bacterium]